MYSRLNKEKLFWMRQELKLTQEQMADRCAGNEFQDFHRTYKRLESGKVLRPHKSTMKKILHGFGLNSANDIMLKANEFSDPLHVQRYEKSTSPKVINSTHQIKLVGFDADNCLLRGFEYSWKEVWRYLGFDDKIRRDAMRRYYIDKDLSYSSWCRYCVSHFASKKLTKKDFNEITFSFKLVRNLRHGLQYLKDNGIIVVLISGGIDTFVESMIPDYKTLFDHVYINQLVYRQGIIFDVNPTCYDFEGKALCLAKLRHDYQISKEHVFFVGEGVNDQFAASEAGSSIAWNPTSTETELSSREVLFGDDFMEVVYRICPLPEHLRQFSKDLSPSK